MPELASLLAEDKPLDRTTVNSLEDIEFLRAVRATGRRKLIICALWTEVCMAFSALDALREGYEVHPVVDAIAGTSPEAHQVVGRYRSTLSSLGLSSCASGAGCPAEVTRARRPGSPRAGHRAHDGRRRQASEPPRPRRCR